MSRLQIALSVYALLAVVAWFTLSDPRFRYLTIAFLAFFAIRVITTSMRQKLEDREKQDEKSDPEE
jgi:hypothetical protein